jgi:hypothetical protein
MKKKERECREVLWRRDALALSCQKGFATEGPSRIVLPAVKQILHESALLFERGTAA